MAGITLKHDGTACRETFTTILSAITAGRHRLSTASAYSVRRVAASAASGGARCGLNMSGSCTAMLIRPNPLRWREGLPFAAISILAQSSRMAWSAYNHCLPTAAATAYEQRMPQPGRQEVTCFTTDFSLLNPCTARCACAAGSCCE